MEIYLDDSHDFTNGDSYTIVSSQEHLVGNNGDGQNTPEEDPVPHIFADTVNNFRQRQFKVSDLKSD